MSTSHESDTSGLYPPTFSKSFPQPEGLVDHILTVANGWEHESKVTQTYANNVEREPFATHSGKHVRAGLIELRNTRDDSWTKVSVCLKCPHTMYVICLHYGVFVFWLLTKNEKHREQSSCEGPFSKTSCVQSRDLWATGLGFGIFVQYYTGQSTLTQW